VADGRWRITVTAPDWGQDHLSLEAVVAYVDGELAPGPHSRASQHLGQCPQCANQVSAQGQARKALRTAGGPCLPSALLSSLRAIPQDADLPGPPPGLAVSADGQLVSVLRPERRPSHPGGHEIRVQTRASHPQLAAPPVPAARPGPASPRSRRLRVGTGVAVSGLALGALVFGAPGTTPGAPAPAAPIPTAHRGVPVGPGFGGSGGSPGVLDARLQLGGPAPAAPGVER
jgi:anti-sigma factor RsiW